jgi:hypothetical protein
MITAAQNRNILIAIGSILFVSVVILILWSGGPRLKILDPRFHIVSASTFRGTNQTVFFESQMGGSMKQTLAKLGLGIKPPTQGTLSVYGTNLCLSVVYDGEFTSQQLENVRAELVTGSGKTFRLLQNMGGFQANTKKHLGAWLVDFRSMRLQLTNNSNYFLRLRLTKDGPPLAEIPVGTLKP